ncbi:MAG: hypothetical protein IK025_08400 [Bacteroidales bacterium]|nr:hypothetical protein [Bacteroidales bacterium]
MTFIQQDISALPFLAVIPQSRTNRRRNEPCEFAYAESPIVTSKEITDSRLHTAHRSVSRVCFSDAFASQHSKQVCSAFGFQSIQSGFRNDYLFYYSY